MKREPITNPQSSGSQKVSRPDADRNKPAGSAGPAFVGNDLRGFPSPSNPYGKGK